MLIQGKKYTYHAKAGENEGGGGSEADPDLEKSKNNDPEDDDSVPPEIEEKARKMGWTPKDEFRGDPEKWRGAAEFVDRGENMLPILRKKSEQQERKIADLQQTIKDFVEHSSKADKIAFERALKALKAEQVAAVASGNADKFVEVDERIADLHKEANEKAKITIKETDPGEDPEYLEWESRNTWIKKDMECAAYADSYAEFLRKTGDKRVGSAFLDEVAKGVKEKFPKKFNNPRREQAGAVESNSPASRGKGGKTFADMPAEARAACDRMARNGYEGKPKEMADFKANYVKTYFEEE